MTQWLYPFERRVVRSRRIGAAILLLLVFLLLLLLDRAIYTNFSLLAPTGAAALDRAAWDTFARHQHRLEGNGLYQMFRAAGFLPTWLLIGGALLLQSQPWRGGRPSGPAAGWGGLLIILAAAFSGGLADLLKPLIGRLRPNLTDGIHAFRGFPGLEPARVANGLPSSHAAVAFGAAFMVAFLYPRAGCLALVAAAGCGVTRVLSGAHFTTDAFAGALLGYAVAKLLRPGGWGVPKGWLLP